MKMFSLVLTRDEVIALGRAISNEVALLRNRPIDQGWETMDNLTTYALLCKVIEKMPEPEELEVENHV